MLPRHRPLTLRRVVDDDRRLLPVEQLQQQVEFVGHVIGVIGIALVPLADIKREGVRPCRIAPNADHPIGIRLFQKIFRGMNAERPATAKHCITFAHGPPSKENGATIESSRMKNRSTPDPDREWSSNSPLCNRPPQTTQSIPLV